jgi:hypothetical protein
MPIKEHISEFTSFGSFNHPEAWFCLYAMILPASIADHLNIPATGYCVA